MPKADYSDDELSLINSKLKELSFQSLDIIENQLSCPDTMSPKDLVSVAQDVLDRAGIVKQKQLSFDSESGLTLPIEAVAGALSFLATAFGRPNGVRNEGFQEKNVSPKEADKNTILIGLDEPETFETYKTNKAAPKKKKQKKTELNQALLERM